MRKVSGKDVVLFPRSFDISPAPYIYARCKNISDRQAMLEYTYLKKRLDLIKYMKPNYRDACRYSIFTEDWQPYIYSSLELPETTYGRGMKTAAIYGNMVLKNEPELFENLIAYALNAPEPVPCRKRKRPKRKR